ncbi:MAG: diaminopimelate epimerase [Bacteroidetes bacterium]|nr:diaminopimelate epimerase [Bacteroidota bacterium]
MRLVFEKYQGTGNDFILIDNRQDIFKKDARFIAKLCNRNYGIGADGLILLEESTNSDFHMNFYNPDGSHAGMCGNGARCITSFARRLGIISNKASFTAGDGLHEAAILEMRDSDDTIRISLKDPDIKKNDTGNWVIDTGTPHVILFPEKQQRLDELFKTAVEIRYSEQYAADGINVDFVWMKDDHILVSTYERGVENFTLSCGTGVTASAIAACLSGFTIEPVKVVTPGGTLYVGFSIDGKHFRNIWLQGNTTKVFAGTIEI